MFHSIRLTSCIAAAMLAASGGALAADYDPPIFVEEAPSLVPVEIGSGWYLRGDVGYALKSKAGPFSYRTFDPGPPVAYGSDLFDTGSVSGGFNFGVGFGYHFSDWLRADATLERFKVDFAGTRSDYPLAGWRTEDAASAVAYSLMINGYVDLGTIAGITPMPVRASATPMSNGMGYAAASTTRPTPSTAIPAMAASATGASPMRSWPVSPTTSPTT